MDEAKRDKILGWALILCGGGTVSKVFKAYVIDQAIFRGFCYSVFGLVCFLIASYLIMPKKPSDSDGPKNS